MAFHGGAWDIETSTGERRRADFVIAATGVLHHPRYPEIDGLDRFAGAQFHSARWNHDVPLAGRRVGVVGTGSSAVQIGRTRRRCRRAEHLPANDAVPHFDARVLSDAHGSADMRIIGGAEHALRHDQRAIAILLGWLDRHKD